ncbi:MAG: YggS family pyridoxal phosphate enzyme [Omnitrophica bacterium RIFCSPLOWO2_01_FULL_45_10]|nr:MAG: YggS family pyridoxal phosphate enzyme [Omnitrophica bacterium RIFCSPLOWO2_01_FULL_45_10]
MIHDNVKSVRQKIANACEKVGRNADDVELVCVTKEVSIDEIKEALDAGVQILGENRVKDALSKYKAIGGRQEWHFIGHLQTNKVKDAVRIFSLIHSVDSLRLAKEIDKAAQAINKAQDILIQVNTSGEKTKFGIMPEEAIDFMKEISSYGNINTKGLMTIAPEVDDPEKVRPYFRALRELRDKINELRYSAKQSEASSKGTKYEIRILSMGMTNDFEVAIEEGANMVRIGKAIFRGN